MHPVQHHRALLGVDVIRASTNSGYHLEAMSSAVTTMLSAALRSGGGGADVSERQFTGDGVLLTLPQERLGVLFDVAEQLNRHAEEHNRWHRPDVKLRVAIEIGPVGGGERFSTSRASLVRMLDAEAFKTLVDRCLARRRDATQTGLIVSEHAWRVAFGGDHVRYVRREEFAALRVTNKEYQATARVRIPGFDADSLATMIDEPEHSHAAAASPRSPSAPNIRGPVTGSVVAGQISGPVNLHNHGR
jgi:hypothetical protein